MAAAGSIDPCMGALRVVLIIHHMWFCMLTATFRARQAVRLSPHHVVLPCSSWFPLFGHRATPGRIGEAPCAEQCWHGAGPSLPVILAQTEQVLGSIFTARGHCAPLCVHLRTAAWPRPCVFAPEHIWELSGHLACIRQPWEQPVLPIGAVRVRRDRFLQMKLIAVQLLTFPFLRFVAEYFQDLFFPVTVFCLEKLRAGFRCCSCLNCNIVRKNSVAFLEPVADYVFSNKDFFSSSANKICVCT